MILLLIVLHTNFGDITVELEAEKTPATVENFVNYAKNGFYDGTIFHRVIDGFMIQGGGFNPDMAEKSTSDPIKNEAATGLSNIKGTIAMARTPDPHSASSQFFINVGDNLFLDHKSESMDGWGYCAFGRVTKGMEVVEKIAKVSTTDKNGYSDVPAEPVIIERVEVLEQS